MHTDTEDVSISIICNYTSKILHKQELEKSVEDYRNKCNVYRERIVQIDKELVEASEKSKLYEKMLEDGLSAR